MSAWLRETQSTAPATGAPPEGVSGSEQSIENQHWRIQLDLGTGGIRSLLLRGHGPVIELADCEAAIHPFQAILRNPAGGRIAASQFIQSRFRFDRTGASLAVDSSLAGGIWKSTFRVEAGNPVLNIELEWAGLAPDALLEMPLPLAIPGLAGAGWQADGTDGMSLTGRDFRVVAAGRGAAWRPERGAARLAGTTGRLSVTLTSAPGL